MKTYDILIADDSEVARKAIRILLDAEPRLRVVAEATNGQDAVDMAMRWMPDLVLMDINMPILNGFEATQVIKRELPYMTVVILSVSDDAADLFEAIRNGAQGYLVKSLQPAEWVKYLLGILEGDAPVTQPIAEKILAEFKTSSTKDIASVPSTLTTREREILQCVQQGFTNKGIAEALFISENTVKNHLKNIMAKLHIKNRVQLAIYAREHALND
ncbi:response regulator [Alicyclobacillus fastidiosus]|uniref:Response regulator transcription factor n=1 Tax=Alicyclobacillus fastidiosus TaxID=392011 RepID=A0ABV5ALR0_9BACL|nr:response regulator transcription factor [Alicyclobacillus fastidiosus]WEH11067.1 response regulator transcription factor [Alicyclobacillus fastidiosus]